MKYIINLDILLQFWKLAKRFALVWELIIHSFKSIGWIPVHALVDSIGLVRGLAALIIASTAVERVA